jgi:hypothetical protein
MPESRQTPKYATSQDESHDERGKGSPVLIPDYHASLIFPGLRRSALEFLCSFHNASSSTASVIGFNIVHY